MKNLEKKTIQTLRTLSLEEINEAQSGHPGVALGASPMLYALYAKVLKVNPDDPTWINRDRFVLGAGHGSSLLYASLHLAGFDLSIEDLKSFRKLNSRTPGHPEIGVTSGVDASSGPLGQGIPEGIGMAIAESHLAEKFNKEDLKLIDHYTYVLCGDGDLQEGVTQEALSLAGHLKLSKLIILYDSNDIQLDGKVEDTNTENVKAKYQAMGFAYIKVEDGENVDDILKAINKAKKNDKPTLIEVKTVIGKGSVSEGTNKVHGAPLAKEEVENFRNELGGDSFTVSEEVYEVYKKQMNKNKKVYLQEQKTLEEYKEKYPNEYQTFINQVNDVNVVSVKDLGITFDKDYKKATRVSNNQILTTLSKFDGRLMGGSADLASSCKVEGNDGNYNKDNRKGRNLVFGVREHAMGAICNGITLHGGMRAFCGGFFVFCDYMKPSMRLASIMDLPVLYMYSHDSIAVGEDGPTHQPIEHLTMLRSIPNMNVIRPCDAVEVKEAYDVYLNTKKNPVVFVLTRQDVPTVREETEENLVAKGGYVIYKETGKLEKVLIASGSEVSLAIEVAKELEKEGTPTRVVSLPSFFLFDKQSKEYKEEVLPKGIARVAIEASDATHFYKYLNQDDLLINMSTFGLSAKANIVSEYFGFTKEKVLEKIR